MAQSVHVTAKNPTGWGEFAEESSRLLNQVAQTLASTWHHYSDGNFTWSFSLDGRIYFHELEQWEYVEDLL